MAQRRVSSRTDGRLGLERAPVERPDTGATLETRLLDRNGTQVSCIRIGAQVTATAATGSYAERWRPDGTRRRLDCACAVDAGPPSPAASEPPKSPGGSKRSTPRRPRKARLLQVEKGAVIFGAVVRSSGSFLRSSGQHGGGPVLGVAGPRASTGGPSSTSTAVHLKTKGAVSPSCASSSGFGPRKKWLCRARQESRRLPPSKSDAASTDPARMQSCPATPPAGFGGPSSNTQVRESSAAPSPTIGFWTSGPRMHSTERFNGKGRPTFQKMKVPEKRNLAPQSRACFPFEEGRQLCALKNRSNAPLPFWEMLF
ncbi:hypothetical protein M885DRAFT_14112 [Pelagophyceae sp. CCMP2097]|nr:hypothetical protein M885DRAFT_14112 [Pelagophyceae sp. CCMP2097]